MLVWSKAEDRLVGVFWSVGSRRMPVCSDARQCRFELMESRRMLAADLTAVAPSLSLPGGADGNISGGVFAEDESGAVGMANVRVQLLSETGAVIEEQLTDGQGAYRFSGLLPGVYAVQEVTPVGYSDVLSQAGSGGGMSLNANLFGEIMVGAGDTLTGYNFYDSLIVSEQEGGGDQRIDAHGSGGSGGTILPIVALSMQTSEVSDAEVIFEPGVVEVLESGQSVTATLLAGSDESAFGDADRAVKRRLPEQAIEENPFDSLFSLTGFLELASANLPSVESLGQLFDDVGSELQELLGQAGESSEESAAMTKQDAAQPQIARRNELPKASEGETDDSPSAGASQADTKAARDEHAEAVDKIFAVGNRVDYRSAEPIEPASESETPQRRAS